MKKVRITAVRKVGHRDLMSIYENPIEHACDVCEGQSWVSVEISLWRKRGPCFPVAG